jgi:hypothetical protein
MQDLNQLPNTPEEDEAMDALAKLGGGIGLKEVLFDYENAPEVPKETKDAIVGVLHNAPPQPSITKEQWMEYGMNNPISASAIDYATQHAPDLQPSVGTNVPSLESVLQSIAEQFALLSTVIKGGAGNSLSVEDQSKSLQDCVSLTLQQADWFKEMVRGIIDDTYDFEAHAEGAVETVVEKEVEHYFDTRFCPEDHFDFGDAVSDAVDDRLDDIVSDKIDDVVQEKFDDFMENATITINK